MPNTSVLADSLQAMTTHGDVFKMKLLMYLISVVFAPTTSLRPSNKCSPILVNDLSLLHYFPSIFWLRCHVQASHCQFFLMFFHLISDAETHCPENCAVQAKLKDVKNMNWCKFIVDFLHDAFSNKMYQKGCQLNLMVFFYQSFL